MDKTQNEIQFETPTYPELGNVYKGDYYEGLPFEKYIDFKQPIPQHTPEKPVFDIRDFGAVAQEGRLNTEAFQAAANGKATKIIIPSEIQGLAGLAAAAKTVFDTEDPKATITKTVVKE